MWRVQKTSDELLQEAGLASHLHQGTHTHLKLFQIQRLSWTLPDQGNDKGHVTRASKLIHMSTYWNVFSDHFAHTNFTQTCLWNVYTLIISYVAM